MKLKRKVGIIAAVSLLCLLLVSVFLVGCNGDGTTSTTEKPIIPPEGFPANWVDINDSALIYPDDCTGALQICASELFSILNEAQVNISVAQSGVAPNGKYIYICDIETFEDQYDVYLGLNDYCILTDNEGIVISAGGMTALKRAVEAFSEKVYSGRYYFENETNIYRYAAMPNNDKFNEILEAYNDTNGRLMNVAHRADHQNYPENSLPAIQSCIDAGVDIVELDISRTKDGKWVLMHDGSVDRTTNGSGNVSEMTLAEIQSLRLRQGKGGSGAPLTDLYPPSFEEVLEICAGKIIINIDKNANEARYFDEIYSILEKYNAVSSAQFKTSESPEVVKARFDKLAAQGKELPHYSAMIYSDNYSYTTTRIRQLEGITKMIELGYTGSASELLSVIKLARECGMRCMVLTLYNDDNSIIWADWLKNDYGAFMTEHALDLDQYITSISNVKDATEFIRLADFTEYYGIKLVNRTSLEKNVVGRSLTSISNGDYVKLPKINFSGDENGVYLSADGDYDGCKAKIFIDSRKPENLIATVDLEMSSGFALNFAKLDRAVEGEHDVYIVFAGNGDSMAIADYITFTNVGDEPIAAVGMYVEASPIGTEFPDTVKCFTVGGGVVESAVEWDRSGEPYDVGVHTVNGRTENGLDVKLTVVVNEAIHITSETEWNEFAAKVNAGDGYSGKTIILDNDLDFRGKTFTVVGSSTGTPFKGIFYGNGKTITNVNITLSEYAGVFGYANGATIKNLNLSLININTVGRYAGALIAYGDGVVITDCNVEASTVNSTRDSGDLGGVGVFAGYVESTATREVRLENCSAANSKVSGKRDVGGFIGDFYSGYALNCLATAVVVDARGNSVAGFAGNTHGGILESCHCFCTVNSTGANLGAFVGYSGGNPTYIKCTYNDTRCAHNPIGRADGPYSGTITVKR